MSDNPIKFKPGDVRAYFLRHEGSWVCDEYPETILTCWAEDAEKSDAPEVVERMKAMNPGETITLGDPEDDFHVECHMVSQKWLNNLPDWYGW